MLETRERKKVYLKQSFDTHAENEVESAMHPSPRVVLAWLGKTVMEFCRIRVEDYLVQKTSHSEHPNHSFGQNISVWNR